MAAADLPPALLARALSPAQWRALGLLSATAWASSMRSRLDQRSCRVLRALGLAEARTMETKWRMTALGAAVIDARAD